MKEHLPKDNFEDFIKGRLEAFDGEPTSDMWARIQPVIPPTPMPLWKSLLTKYWTVVGGAVAIVGISTFLVVGYQQERTETADLKQALEEANTQIEQLTDKVQALNNDQNQPLSPTDSPTSAPQGKIKNSKNDQISTADITKSNTVKSVNKSTTKTNNQSVTTKNPSTPVSVSSTPSLPINKDDDSSQRTNIVQQLLNTNNPTPPLKNTKEETGQETIPIANRNKKEEIPTVIENIALLPTFEITPYETNYVLGSLDSISSVIDPISIPQKRAKEIYVFGQNQRARSERPNPNSTIHQQRDLDESVKNGYGFGIKVKWNLDNNWKFVIGGIYNRSNSEHSQNFRIFYNKDNERLIPNTGTIRNSTPLLIPLPSGDLQEGFSLLLGNSTAIEDKESIRLSTRVAQQLTTLSIPIYAQYNLLNRVESKWYVGVKMGLLADFYLNQELTLKSAKTDYPGLRLLANNPNFKTPPLSQQTALNLLTGLSVSYEITDNVLVTIEPTFYRRFIEEQKGTLSHLKASVHNVQLGVAYVF